MIRGFITFDGRKGFVKITGNVHSNYYIQILQENLPNKNFGEITDFTGLIWWKSVPKSSKINIPSLVELQVMHVQLFASCILNIQYGMTFSEFSFFPFWHINLKQLNQLKHFMEFSSSNLKTWIRYMLHVWKRN